MADPRLVVKLKAVRTAAGLTQQELADRAGLSRKTVNTVENGVFTPSVLVALTLAQALGVPLDALFTLEG
ncbi:helix-turn-helix transcriptional regulator [Brevundimonas diminuta]|uniref:Anaerobic benzoate catabolism transcriptional regulator n=1 Tax=Brevundimonas diminuta TaxID=293 RepID=A0A2X1ADY7_BREDI|nr:helix-turn-helix transcriptional regulator [Brevundimonas diminuta]SPU42597.1 anaerobic benzoate catabolism transcriptional regulator [Brevundimonas diminuta]